LENLPIGFQKNLRMVSCGDFFLSWEIAFHERKTLRGHRTAAEWKMSLVRPAAGGESCKAGFFK